jgi:hypothetical protein
MFDAVALVPTRTLAAPVGGQCLAILARQQQQKITALTTVK